MELHAQILNFNLVLLHSFLVFRLRLLKHLPDLLLLALHFRLDLHFHRLHLLFSLFLKVQLDLLNHAYLRLEDLFDASLRFLSQGHLLGHHLYIFLFLLKLCLQLSDLFLQNGPFLRRVKLCVLQFLPKRQILTLKTIHTLLLFLQRLSKLVATLVKIFHFSCKLKVFLDYLSPQLLNLRILFLSLRTQTHCELFHSSHLLLDFSHFILLLSLFNFRLTQFFSHFGGLFLMHGNFLFKKLSFDFKSGTFLNFDLRLLDKTLERTCIGLKL